MNKLECQPRRDSAHEQVLGAGSTRQGSGLRTRGPHPGLHRLSYALNRLLHNSFCLGNGRRARHAVVSRGESHHRRQHLPAARTFPTGEPRAHQNLARRTAHAQQNSAAYDAVDGGEHGDEDRQEAAAVDGGGDVYDEVGRHQRCGGGE